MFVLLSPQACPSAWPAMWISQRATFLSSTRQIRANGHHLCVARLDHQAHIWVLRSVRLAALEHLGRPLLRSRQLRRHDGEVTITASLLLGAASFAHAWPMPTVRRAPPPRLEHRNPASASSVRSLTRPHPNSTDRRPP